MNTLLNLMHQVWQRRTPARLSAAGSAAAPPRRSTAVSQQHAKPASDLWSWYQSRCVMEPEHEIPRR